MATINIANRDDPFYRYKMPRVVAKIEGKGNGIKTVIPNMADIAKSLARDPSYPTKFFGFELGAQTTIDTKTAPPKYIVNGAFDAARLQEVMDKFIDKYVLCGKCGNPETDLVVKRDEVIRRCKACGKDSGTDKAHKCTAFIVKNPPVDLKKAKKVASDKSAASKEGGPTPPDSPGRGGNSGDEAAEDAADQEELTRRIEAEAAELPEAAVRDGDDDDWAEDLTPEAVARRQAELGASLDKIEKLAIGDDDDGDEDPDLKELSDWTRAHPTATDDEVLARAKDLYVKDYKALTVLPAALLRDCPPAELARRAAARAPLFKRLAHSEKGQKAALGGFERLFRDRPELMPRVPLALKALYDGEVVDEEVFVAWGAKSSKKYVDKKTNKEIRERAEKFLQWLQEAEEDDSDEEDDE